MRQILLLVVALALIAAAFFVVRSKSASGSDSLVVRNAGSQVLMIAVGNKPAEAVAANGTVSDEFVEGIMLRVWVGDKAEGFASGWRVYRVAGEVTVGYDGEAVTIEGDGLDFTPLNNGPGANAVPETK